MVSEDGHTPSEFASENKKAYYIIELVQAGNGTKASSSVSP